MCLCRGQQLNRIEFWTVDPQVIVYAVVTPKGSIAQCSIALLTRPAAAATLPLPRRHMR
jgi:hypothetical protein